MRIRKEREMYNLVSISSVISRRREEQDTSTRIANKKEASPHLEFLNSPLMRKNDFSSFHEWPKSLYKGKTRRREDEEKILYGTHDEEHCFKGLSEEKTSDRTMLRRKQNGCFFSWLLWIKVFPWDSWDFFHRDHRSIEMFLENLRETLTKAFLQKKSAEARNGGAGESRTRVRKAVNRRFSKLSSSVSFPVRQLKEQSRAYK